jgi:hypothetical protein
MILIEDEIREFVYLDYHCEDWYDFNLIQIGHVLAFKNFIENLPFIDYHLKPVKPTTMSESWLGSNTDKKIIREAAGRDQFYDVTTTIGLLL